MAGGKEQARQHDQDTRSEEHWEASDFAMQASAYRIRCLSVRVRQDQGAWLSGRPSKKTAEGGLSAYLIGAGDQAALSAAPCLRRRYVM